MAEAQTRRRGQFVGRRCKCRRFRQAEDPALTGRGVTVDCIHRRWRQLQLSQRFSQVREEIMREIGRDAPSLFHFLVKLRARWKASIGIERAVHVYAPGLHVPLHEWRKIGARALKHGLNANGAIGRNLRVPCRVGRQALPRFKHAFGHAHGESEP